MSASTSKPILEIPKEPLLGRYFHFAHYTITPLECMKTAGQSRLTIIIFKDINAKAPSPNLKINWDNIIKDKNDFISK
jgi:hypothetical protein